MAAHEVAEPSESLKYKTWVLKVSINCEGCKRKVEKILHNIEGVYEVDVDTRQQKATVIGNVEADTLIKKLVKSGKHAELWPCPNKEKKSGKSKNRDKVQDEPQKSEDQSARAADKDAKPVKVEVVVPDSSRQSQDGGAGVAASVAQPKINGEVASAAPAAPAPAAKVRDGAAANSGGGEAVTASKSEEKKKETGSAGNQPPASENNGGEGGAASGAERSGGSINSGKKKKKKGHNGNDAEGQQSSGGRAGTGSPKHHAGPPPVSHQANSSPPRHQGTHYPPHPYYPPHYYYAPPPPVYAVSYNTAHPSAGNTTSYYAPPPPYSYAYAYPGPEVEPPPPDLESHPRQPSDSFEIFSDENPNGCSIM